MNIFRAIAVCALAISITGCAQTKFNKLNDDGTIAKKNVGLPFYLPAPHLLVKRPQNKEGATTTEIVYLPDTSKPYSISHKGGFGSAEMSVTLSGGMITAFNQTTDSKIPETVEALGSLTTGVGDAILDISTAEKVDAEEAEIRNRILSGLDTKDAKADEEAGKDTEDPLRIFYAGSVNACKSPVLNLPAEVPPNEALSPRDITTLLKAANRFACASSIVNNKFSNEQETVAKLEKTSRGLIKITTKEFDDSRTALTPKGVKPEELEAYAIRGLTKEWKTLDMGDSDRAEKVNREVTEGIKEAEKVAAKFKPAPKPSPPAYELYRITQKHGITYYQRVSDMNSVCTAAKLSPEQCQKLGPELPSETVTEVTK